MTPDVSIIIVNWNSQAFVGQCLTTLFRNASDLTYEVFVVDNASFDGIAGLLAAQFPSVTFIQCQQNVGFASANNLAFSQCRGKNVLFLNPDTEIQGQAIQALVSALELLPHAGMVGARLLNSDLSVQTNCVTAVPSLRNQLLSCELLRTWFPRWDAWGMQALLQGGDTPIRVDAISGACMLARRSVLASVGAFSTDYFMYLEDMDLCVKIRRAGSEIYYVPTATIVHHGGGSSALRRESNFSSIMLLKSLVRFFQIHRGHAYAAGYRACLVVVSVLRVLLLLIAFPVLLTRRGFGKAALPLRKWSGIFLWSVGATRWAFTRPRNQAHVSTTPCRVPGTSA